MRGLVPSQSRTISRQSRALAGRMRMRRRAGRGWRRAGGWPGRPGPRSCTACVGQGRAAGAGADRAEQGQPRQVAVVGEPGGDVGVAGSGRRSSRAPRTAAGPVGASAPRSRRWWRACAGSPRRVRPGRTRWGCRTSGSGVSRGRVCSVRRAPAVGEGPPTGPAVRLGHGRISTSRWSSLWANSAAHPWASSLVRPAATRSARRAGADATGAR